MKTKYLILDASRELFNKMGVINITLRDVAKSINKSYGNITYHFSTKEDLILHLFNQMNNELLVLQDYDQNENIMVYLLNLPSLNYSISLKYLFFITDSLEIKRNYPKLQNNNILKTEERRAKWLKILQLINENKYFRDKITNNDLEYIMFLSYSVRISYFQTLELKNYSKTNFTLFVNKLIEPYLSKKGKRVYKEWLKIFIAANIIENY